jgi:hypothetical protein
VSKAAADRIESQAGVSKAATSANAQACVTKSSAAEISAADTIGAEATVAAAADAAAANAATAPGLNRGRHRQDERKCRHDRQKDSVHHCLVLALPARLGSYAKERSFIWGVRARIAVVHRHFVADLGNNGPKSALARGAPFC